MMRRVLALSLSIVLAGCGIVRDQADPSRPSVRGVPATIDRLPFEEVAERQTRLTVALAQQAGLVDADGKVVLPAKQSSDWRLVLKSGVQMVENQCDAYLDSLFRFNREQLAGRQGLSAVGGASAAIMGLANAPAGAIAATAAAFGLTTSLFDAAANSVLFQIEPSAIRNVSLEARRKFLKEVQDRIAQDPTAFTNRPDALIAVQGYLAQCSPAALEANINNAASGSPNAVTATNARAQGPALEVTSKGFSPSGATVAVPPDNAPADMLMPHAQPGEERLTRAFARRVQAALGVPVDGDPGSPTSITRRAVAEFQRAMAARDETAFRDPPDGRLTGRTRDLLGTMSRFPDNGAFHSVFERFFLGAAAAPSGAAYTAPDPDRVRQLRRRLNTRLFEGDAGAQLPEGTELDAATRQRLAAVRAGRSLPPGDALDSALHPILYSR